MARWVAFASVALALVPAVLGALPGPGVVRPAPAQAASRAQLSEELEANRARLQKAREAIQRAEALRKAALGDINALDVRIDGLEDGLAKVTARRDAVAAQLAKTHDELAGVVGALDDTKAQLARTEEDLLKAEVARSARAVNMYKSGRLGYLEVLLNAHRLSELVTRMHLFSLVVEQDARVVREVDALRVRVTAQKAALEEQRIAVAAVEKRQTGQKSEIDALVREQKSGLAQLDTARDDKKTLLAEAEKDKASWERKEDSLLAESDRLAADLRALGERAGAVVGTGQFVWPVNGRVSSPFGYRIHPIFHVRKMHTGIDLSAGMGTPIKAADSGTVVQAGWRGGYGKCVVISHGNGVATLYAHQSVISVSVGDTVERGQAIGNVGSTGYSTGAHLHFEVRVDGSPVDPMRYL
jgi:murein DD-endopeptidase MepM/ murein hydrolase activator NlpD